MTIGNTTRLAGYRTAEHAACGLAGMLVVVAVLVLGSSWLATVVSVFDPLETVALVVLTVCWWVAWWLAFEAVRVHLRTG